MTTGRPPAAGRTSATPTSDDSSAGHGDATRGSRRMLGPATTGPPHRGRRTRRRWVGAAALVAGVLVLFGAGLAAGAASPQAPVSPAAVAQPAPSTPIFPPPVLPSGSVRPTASGQPTSSVRPTPCLVPPGQPLPPGCIPPPVTTVPGPAQPGPGGGSGGGSSCDFWDPSTWLDCLFRGVVVGALNPLLDLMGKTLLTTPHPSSLPGIGVVWTNSFHLLLAGYAIFIALGGIVVMAHESLQTRYSIKEIAPRLVVGFLAGVLSMMVAGMAIQVANALAGAVMGQGLDPTQAATSLKQMVLNALTGGVWILFIGLILAAALIALLVSYVLRVAITVILIGGAPLALMFHGSPYTEGIAFWWWRAIGACLAIQIAQSLTLVTALRVFLTPGGFTVLGPSPSGLVNLLVALTLTYILFRIPFWFLSATRIGNGRSFVGGLAKAYVAGKAFGLLGGRGHRSSPTAAHATRPAHPPRAARPADPAWPIPITQWQGLGGLFSPQARANRLAGQQQTRAGTAPRPASSVRPPRFQQPSPQTPTHDLGTGHASTAASAPTFSSAASTNPKPARPAPAPPTAPAFRVPGATRPASTPPQPPIRAAAVPTALRFRPANPEPPAAPMRSAASAPRPGFRSATPTSAAPTRRARTHTPPPVRFQAPPARRASQS